MQNKIGIVGVLFRSILLFCLIVLWLWGSTAIFFSFPGTEWLRGGMALFFVCMLPAFFWFLRSFYKGLALSLVCLAVLFYWWQTLQPTNEKEWAADVSRITHGEITGETLFLHNVRNFHYYKNDKTSEEWQEAEQWESREYNLDEIQGLDLFLSYWASEHIAHVIMSWDFGEDRHLAISIETRKDIHQEYSAVQGFFKQFELSYVAADEEDLIRLRTNFRKERVYLYRLLVSKEKARALLEAYVSEMNGMVSVPQFYDALTRNCTTAIFLHTKAINPDDPPPMDWRILASGHLDKLLYNRGMLSQKLPFPELRDRSRVDLHMQSMGGEKFSRRLRASKVEVE
jgi:Domain of unknown function (DUF4105)